MTSNHRPLEEGDIELIDRIRGTPSLYDSRDPDFRLVFKKDKQWQVIADGLAMTHWEARKRWTVLRDRYARELKQLLMHPDSMEYGKNEFFHRMDFLRSFVKKRRVRRKCYDSQSDEINEANERPKPLKISKVTTNNNCFEIYHHNQEQDDQDTYIIDDSQESSTGKCSFIEQPVSQEHNQPDNQIMEEVEDQDYHEFVEDASESYDAVLIDPDNQNNDVTSNHSSVAATISNVVQFKPNMSATTFAANYSITSINEENTNGLPILQHKSILEPPSCSLATTTSTSEQNDIEDYFSKTIASYLKQLSRRYKIKAKVEMMQILEKYIDLEEMEKKS